MKLICFQISTDIDLQKLLWTATNQTFFPRTFKSSVINTFLIPSHQQERKISIFHLKISASREELSSAHFQLVFWLHSDIFTSIHGIQPRDDYTFPSSRFIQLFVLCNNGTGAIFWKLDKFGGNLLDCRHCPPFPSIICLHL